MQYTYKALQNQGQTIKGQINAATSREALRLLQAQGLTVLSIKESSSTLLRRPGRHKRLTQKIVHLFMNQLTALLQADIPIDETVSTLLESEENDRLRRECAIMRKTLQNGLSFSEALKATSLPLPSYYYLLAKSGEMTGNLAESMQAANTQWQYEQETKRRALAALTYPTILICTGIAAVLLIFILVVPRFESLIGKSGKEVPLITQVILVPGTFFNHHMFVLLVLAGSLVLGALTAVKSPKIKQHFFELLGRAPLTSTWIHETETGRWASMMATLLANQVPLVQALELAGQFIALPNMQGQFQRLTNAVRAGASLSDALKERNLLPVTAVNLIRVGERTGDLAAMMRSLANLAEDSVKNRTAAILALVEPVAILVIGTVIGLIMAGLILGITSVNELV